MEQAKLLAWWWHRQGLDGRLAGADPATILAEAGWARSVGGTSPYLGIHARGGHSREDIDKAVANQQIHELPSARGCTYILPASDFALGLRAGAQFGEGDMNVARKLGVTDAEVDKLGIAILKTLKSGAMDPDEIKKAVGTAARNLGPEGVKKGVTTTLPLALGRLQTSGEIRRIPINGRLDQQRYRYTLWRPNPLDKFKPSVEECYTELARKYFRWIGPATIAEFQWFSGLGVGASKKAVEPLGLVRLDEDRWMFPEDRDALLALKVPKGSDYKLLGGLDSLVLLRRNLRSLITEENVHPLLEGKHNGGLQDLPSHGIFDRGRLVGLWEFDTATNTIAALPFVKMNQDLKKAIEQTQEFVVQDLGDARSFSLDSPKSRISKIEALRAAAATS